MQSAARALSFKEQGNLHLSAGRCEEAIKAYTHGIDDPVDGLACLSNRANVFSRVGKDDEALRDSVSLRKRIIKLEDEGGGTPENVAMMYIKANFRIGKLFSRRSDTCAGELRARLLKDAAGLLKDGLHTLKTMKKADEGTFA